MSPHLTHRVTMLVFEFKTLGNNIQAGENGFTERSFIGYALTGNIKGRSVIRRGADAFQPRGKVHPFAIGKRFERNQTLIMIQG